MLRAALLSLALMAGAPVLAQTPAAAPPAVYVKPAPPGERVDIGGRRLHIQCEGQGAGPVVVFEAGLSQFTAQSTYGKAQDLIAAFAKVCSYDRAGLGWSDPAPSPRTQQDMVEDLHKLMAAKGIKGPLVLVGHSMGGLLVRLYTKTYPQDVAGVVLVDSSTEAFNFGPGAPASRAASIASIDGALKDAKDGVPVAPFPATTPPDVMMAYTPEILRAVKQEYEAIGSVPEVMRTAGGYGTLGDKPLAVIRRGLTATPPSQADIQWRKAQEGLTSLSSRSFLVVAEKSGHVIPYDEPAVVADAARRILAMCVP